MTDSGEVVLIGRHRHESLQALMADQHDDIPSFGEGPDQVKPAGTEKLEFTSLPGQEQQRECDISAVRLPAADRLIRS